MPNCTKCGKEVDRRGIYVHERWCKGTVPVTETEDSPEVETAKKVLHPPKPKKAVKVRQLKEEIEDEEEEEEQEPEEYASQPTNPLWYLLVLLPLAAIAYLWYKLRGKEE